MKIQAYQRPQTMEEAYQLLLQNDDNTVMGGGAWLKLTNRNVDTIIDISELQLHTIEQQNDNIVIGSMTTLRQLETSPIIQECCQGILAKAANSIMGMNVRNIATIGGSIMGKYSFSDIITPLLAMNATLVFYHNKEMALADFLNTKHVEKDILVAIKIPKTNYPGYFYNVKKTAIDFAVLNVAIVNGDSCTIAIGARPGGSVIATKAMEYINSHLPITDEVMDQAAQIAQEEIHVSSNFRASQEYRELLIKVYVKRGLKEVCKQ
ncbi:FAD binding domain-containing protein [Candidatus Xianfuyuplasma coldseepsis]|uniref:FAD-binding protein n=1 Tax=Candidatus Xianfuyuplasma coldseepsis TaxID=2782163 RepID=A0A7L7KQ68_9MOLU|nr:FAD binding domain-containing protein [Xianfuyuplasma coldseepsis]QMS84412.1 FAD-binding protein [Xianfuyuplasma coldseepsis]